MGGPSIEKVTLWEDLIEKVTLREGLIEKVTLWEDLIEKVTLWESLIEEVTLWEGLIEKVTRDHCGQRPRLLSTGPALHPSRRLWTERLGNLPA